MGINTVVTPEDLLVTESTKPGWYQLEIVEYNEQVTKSSEDKPSDGSMNAVFSMKIISEGPWKGRDFKKFVNEKPKSMAFSKNFWAVLFGKDWNKQPLTSDMFRGTVGKKLQGYVQKQKDGKYDEIADFRPLEAK